MPVRANVCLQEIFVAECSILKHRVVQFKCKSHGNNQILINRDVIIELSIRKIVKLCCSGYLPNFALSIFGLMLKGISGRAMVHSSMLLTMLLITILSLPAVKNVAKTLALL